VLLCHSEGHRFKTGTLVPFTFTFFTPLPLFIQPSKCSLHLFLLYVTPAPPQIITFSSFSFCLPPQSPFPCQNSESLATVCPFSAVRVELVKRFLECFPNSPSVISAVQLFAAVTNPRLFSCFFFSLLRDSFACRSPSPSPPVSGTLAFSQDQGRSVSLFYFASQLRRARRVLAPLSPSVLQPGVAFEQGG